MGRVTKGLLLLAVVVPVSAYVAGSLASVDGPVPTDHSPVILRDAPGGTTEPSEGRDPQRPAPRPTETPEPDRQQDERGTRVVTPPPVPVGEDDDDDWDDDGPEDDDTDDRAEPGDD